MSRYWHSSTYVRRCQRSNGRIEYVRLLMCKSLELRTAGIVQSLSDERSNGRLVLSVEDMPGRPVPFSTPQSRIDVHSVDVCCA